MSIRNPIEADGARKPSCGLRRQKTAVENIDLSRPVELVAVAVKDPACLCRLPGTDKTIFLRAGRLWKAAPGAILTVTPKRQWRYGGHLYISGEIKSTRIDVKALGLVPLGLKHMGMWDPEEEYWGEENEPVHEWARRIIAYGPRPMFRMEQVLPGEDPDDPFNDPITLSNDLKEAGEHSNATKILMEICQADLRCLDAHSHLGNLVFEHFPQDAIRHYEIGLRIGELSLGEDFNGVLPWAFVDNRPFLRCMHGYGSCLWRLERFDEAGRIFQKMLWLNPTDNQGVRFIIDEVKGKTAWEDREGD
jgi:hypothetical protein